MMRQRYGVAQQGMKGGLFARVVRLVQQGGGLVAGAALLVLSCGIPTLAPQPGQMQSAAPLTLEIPGGRVSLANGNFSTSRIDLSLETALGPFAVGAVYNSANNAWR